MADGNAVTFDASGSYDPEGHGLSYAWDFGDGFSGASMNPNHTFGSPGDYAVALTVTDSQGQTESSVMTLSIGSLTGQTSSMFLVIIMQANPYLLTAASHLATLFHIHGISGMEPREPGFRLFTLTHRQENSRGMGSDQANILN